MVRVVASLKYVACFLLSFVVLWTHFGFAHRRQFPVDWETALRVVLPETILSSVVCLVVVVSATKHLPTTGSSRQINRFAIDLRPSSRVMPSGTMPAKCSRHSWLRATLIVVLVASGFVLLAVLHGLGSPPSAVWTSSGAIKLGAFFASLGALFGIVFALDSRSGIAVANARVLRTVVCAFFGSLVVLTVSNLGSFSPSFVWYIAGSGTCAALGWFGWRWVRYFDV